MQGFLDTLRNLGGKAWDFKNAIPKYQTGIYQGALGMTDKQIPNSLGYGMREGLVSAPYNDILTMPDTKEPEFIKNKKYNYNDDFIESIKKYGLPPPRYNKWGKDNYLLDKIKNIKELENVK